MVESTILYFFSKLRLLCSLNRSLSEILHSLHEVESSLTSACTCSLVTLLYLSVSVSYEYLVLCLDLIYKLFHFN